MQHGTVSLTCPACQSSISVQLPLQLHDEQNQQQRLLQLLESQKTLLESVKILDQGRDADRQGELAKAFQLYKVGLAMAIPNLKLWPVINPMIPMMDECRSRVWWTMGRSEKISAALAAWALTFGPSDTRFQAAEMSAADAAAAEATSSGPRPSATPGTKQSEQLAPWRPLHNAELSREMKQMEVIYSMQQKAKQQVAREPVAREPQQQHWQHVDRVEGQNKQQLQQQQQQQQQQQLQEHQKQQPEHQQLEDRTFVPRQPLNPPPNRLLQIVKPTAGPKASGVASGVASEVAHKKQRVEMREEVKEEQEGDVNAWTFLEPPSIRSSSRSTSSLRD